MYECNFGYSLCIVHGVFSCILQPVNSVIFADYYSNFFIKEQQF